MTFENPSRRAIENWETASTEERLQVVTWAARSLGRRRWLGRIGSDVVRLGSGMRRRRSPRSGVPQVIDEVALLVFVARKVRPSTLASDSDRKMVPDRIELTVPIGRRRLSFAIPTDVLDDRQIPRAHGLRQGLEVESSVSPGVVDGVACALVRNKDGEGPLYLLGCHHVICRSLVTQDARADMQSVAHGTTSSGQRVRLGPATRPASFGPQEAVSIDAALVRLEGDGVDVAQRSEFWAFRAKVAVKTLSEIWSVASGGLRLYGAGLRHIPLRLIDHRRWQRVRYGSNIVEIAEVLVCEAANGSAPLPGDSGSPVIAGGGALVGMHIAGVPQDRSSFVIPAYQLIEGPAFPRRITLA